MFLDFSVFHRGFLYALTFKKYAEPDSEEVHTTRCCKNSDATLEGFKKPSHDIQLLSGCHQWSATPFTPRNQKFKNGRGALWSKKGVGAESDDLGEWPVFLPPSQTYSIMGNGYSNIHCMVLKN